MFPPRDKSALVKKEMRFFHELVGEDTDGAALLKAARDVALYRVVVKRSKRAGPLGEEQPTYVQAGKSSRYDIYVNRGFKNV